MKIISILIGFSLLFSCLSFCKGDSLPAGWKYEIVITNPGTKSEGKIGRLFYNGRELAPCFKTVLIGNRSFSYKPGIYLWDFRGYIKNEKTGLKEKTSREKIKKSEIETGWYSAGCNEKKKDTPSSWVWVSRGNIEAFTDPSKLVEFVSEKNLKPILHEEKR